MKPIVKNVILGFGLLTLGFQAGRFYQEMKNGYQYRLIEEKEYPSDLGPIIWQNAFESVGQSVLDTDTTSIEFDGRLIYKANRTFQERAPVARGIETEGTRIKWEDGDYGYLLNIEQIPREE